MEHIRYKNSNDSTGYAYTIVKTDDWTLPLDQHPSIVEHPEWFEIVDCDIPNHVDYLIYTG